MSTSSPRAPIAPRYAPATFEAERYASWEAASAGGPSAAGRPTFTMILPPPNITGRLHLGHAYEHTISDALIRYHRMRGEATLWLPGLDHAGIATQNAIERQLATEGLTRHDLGRDAFVDRAWAWKHETAGAITDQMRRLGALPDWGRLLFTLDPQAARAVRTLCTRLFDDGLIYRAERIIGWCDRCATALADIEIDTGREGDETCGRCGTTIVRRSSLQWFLRTQHLAALARDALLDGALEIEPASMRDDYLAWCDSMHDWCISRQLWWGHRLPIWYSPDGEARSFATDAEIPAGWTQDEDVLDTWFSSALWPLTTLGWPDQTPTLASRYPTDLLCTGDDLLFFWAIRMVMLCTYITGRPPFRTLSLHGMIRDAHGKKMSKSFGNAIDPMDSIDRFGADPLRLALARLARPGADISFGEDDLRGADALAKKLWSIARFAAAHPAGPRRSPGADAAEPLLARWLRSRGEAIAAAATACFDGRDLAGAHEWLRGFIEGDLSDFYLEAIRPTLGEGGDASDAVLAALHEELAALLHLLHPLAPFLTDELGEAFHLETPLDRAGWPEPRADLIDAPAESAIADLRTAIRAARSHKDDLGLTQADVLPATVEAPGLERELCSMARLTTTEAGLRPAATLTFGAITLGLPGAAILDAAHRARLRDRCEELARRRAALAARLADQAFLAGAPADVIASRRERLATTEADLARIRTITSR